MQRAGKASATQRVTRTAPHFVMLSSTWPGYSEADTRGKVATETGVFTGSAFAEKPKGEGTPAYSRENGIARCLNRADFVSADEKVKSDEPRTGSEVLLEKEKPVQFALYDSFATSGPTRRVSAQSRYPPFSFLILFSTLPSNRFI